MVNNERLLLNPDNATQWFFEINSQQQLMYTYNDNNNWLPHRSTGVSNVTAFAVCLTDNDNPCIVCLEQQGRLSCIVYKESQWNYYPTAAIPQNTVPEFLNIFCVNDLLYVYSGFRRPDGKLYTFCASRSNNMWTTFKPSSDLYDRKCRILSTLPYKEGIILAIQGLNNDDTISLSFIYMTSDEYTPLYNPITCKEPIQTLSLFYQPDSNDVCALWAEDKRCCLVRNGRFIHNRELSISPDHLFCDYDGNYYSRLNQQIYHLESDLSIGSVIDHATQSTVRQIISHNGSVSNYIGVAPLTVYNPSAPLSGVASITVPSYSTPPQQSASPETNHPSKGINTMSETSSLEERIIALEKKHLRLEKVASALSDQVKHFRAALLQTEDYMQQRDKALYRLESALGRPLTPKNTSNSSQKNKSSNNNYSTPFEDIDRSSSPNFSTKNGQNLYSGMDGLYIINNKSNKTNK